MLTVVLGGGFWKSPPPQQIPFNHVLPALSQQQLTAAEEVLQARGNLQVFASR